VIPTKRMKSNGQTKTKKDPVLNGIHEDLEASSDDYTDEDPETSSDNYTDDKSNTSSIRKEPSPEIGYDRPRTPHHQIVRNIYNQEIPFYENILRMSVKSLAKLDESKYFGEFIPHFMKFKKLEKNNSFSCANDDVMDIRGDSGFSKFLSVDDYIKLRSKKPKRKVELPEDWRNVVEEYFKETTENGSKKNISDWISITEELGVVKKEDNKELIRIKKYLNRVMLPLLESFSKPIPDISAPNTSEYHYWTEFGHPFFSRALQEFVGLDWRARKYAHNHAIDTVVDGKYADLLAWMWETGEEIFVGEQAGPPVNPDLIKSADFLKFYREMRDCLNARILYAMGKGDINYNDRAIFGIFGYLFEIKMVIMWKDGAYVYDEYGSLNIPSSMNQIFMMKKGILQLLEFM
ncbi:5543_t:CDS:2, partial [Acaulospora morrowiae]